MGIIDSAMIHTCQVLRDTGTTQADDGEPITNFVPTDYSCLFDKISVAGNEISFTEAGKIKVTSIICFLPYNAVVEKGDFITTAETNWSGTYEVQDVYAASIPFTETVDHIEATLKEAVKRG